MSRKVIKVCNSSEEAQAFARSYSKSHKQTVHIERIEGSSGRELVVYSNSTGSVSNNTTGPESNDLPVDNKKAPTDIDLQISRWDIPGKRCHLCGGEISAMRLTALPEANTCIACATRLETQNNRPKMVDNSFGGSRETIKSMRAGLYGDMKKRYRGQD